MAVAMAEFLAQLDAALRERRAADPGESYVASLHHKGLDRILEKVGEEATEMILAAKGAERSGDSGELVRETADLWFHCLVALAHLGSDSGAVLGELRRRFGASGLAEKESRGN